MLPSLWSERWWPWQLGLRQHSLQHIIPIEEMVLQRNQSVQARENQERVAKHLVGLLEKFLAPLAGGLSTHRLVPCCDRGRAAIA